MQTGHRSKFQETVRCITMGDTVGCWLFGGFKDLGKVSLANSPSLAAARLVVVSVGCYRRPSERSPQARYRECVRPVRSRVFPLQGWCRSGHFGLCFLRFGQQSISLGIHAFEIGFDARFQLDGIASLQQGCQFVLVLSAAFFARQLPRTRRCGPAFMVTIHLAISPPLFALEAVLRSIKVCSTDSITQGFIERLHEIMMLKAVVAHQQAHLRVVFLPDVRIVVLAIWK